MLLILNGCSRPTSYDNQSQDSSTDYPASAIQANEDTISASNLDNAKSLSPTLAHQNDALIDRQLVIHSSLNFEVKEVEHSVKTLSTLTRQYGGYVADEQIQNQTLSEQRLKIGNGEQKVVRQYRTHIRMVLRIPKQSVVDFLEHLQNEIEYLHEQRFSAQDVALDIQKAQLEQEIQALKAQRLENPKTDNALENTLIAQSAAEARLEALYAQLQQQSLTKDVALATIELNFSQPIRLHTHIEPDISTHISQARNQSFGVRLIDSLKAGQNFLLELLLILAQLWLLFVIALLAWFGFRWFEKKHPITQTQSTDNPENSNQ